MNFFDMVANELESSGEPPPSLTPEQQVIRLREVLALRAETHTFRPGQILQHRYPELAEVKFATDPHCFIEYLENPIVAHERADMEDLGSAAATNRYDCMIACVIRGRTFARFLGDSRMWKQHPDFREN